MMFASTMNVNVALQGVHKLFFSTMPRRTRSPTISIHNLFKYFLKCNRYLSNVTKKVVKPGTHLSTHRSATHRIASTHQCGQHKQPETYAPNMLMCCMDPIRSLSVHQSDLFCACSVLLFLLPRQWTSVFYVKLGTDLCSTSVDICARRAAQCDLPQCGAQPNPSAVSQSIKARQHSVHAQCGHLFGPICNVDSRGKQSSVYR